jgi:oligopeptide transport system ATP-binding protein
MRSTRGSTDMNAPSLLELQDLGVEFATPQGPVHAVAGVTLRVAQGECLAVVGESGSGKTQLFLACMGLLAANGRASGSARFQGRELIGAGEAVLNRIRGVGLSLISQDPMNALTPHLRIERQLTEGVLDRGLMSAAEARQRALEALRTVGIGEPEARLRQYPHELSGGMRQRVAIAVALMTSPLLLVADEPTTALDVTVQARILEVLRALRADGLALVIITHDLGVVADLADRVAVMYAGRLVESAPADTLFAAPAHPYTAGLLASMPRLSDSLRQRLPAIDGQPPRPGEVVAGCPFAPRCDFAAEACREVAPPLRMLAGDREVACHAPLQRESRA